MLTDNCDTLPFAIQYRQMRRKLRRIVTEQVTLMVELRKVLIIANREKEGAEALAAEIEAWLGERKIEVARFVYPDAQVGAPPVDCDLAISLGGDGTVLYSSRVLSKHSIPILPINLGEFGFITEVTADEWQEEIDQFRKGEIGISDRLLIDVAVRRNGQDVARFAGLNDAVVSAGGISKLVRLSVQLSGVHLGHYRADGMIVATPTGSTAYSVAAGGPILAPDMEALILNPICPFTISHRPLVLPAQEIIEIVIEGPQRTNVIITVDGQFEFLLRPGDTVTVRAHADKARILRSHRRTFYEVVRMKLNLSGGPNA